jgi:hypothetical protein
VATSDPDIARVFGIAPTQDLASERPATRILPDLTAKPALPVVDEVAPRTRKVRSSLKPRIPRAKPALPLEVEAPVVIKPMAMRVGPIRVRVRPKDESGLPRGERWKRRLPRYAR